jgi:L-aminopeptidase/D-esterase-like protein
VSQPQLLSAFAGHWTGNGTGVTVIVPPPGTVGSGEVRGGAPATREFELLAPTRLVQEVSAVVLSGGSAFGLAAGDGVMRALRAREIGFATPLGPVPIVVGMSIFDGSVAGFGGSVAGFEGSVAGFGGSVAGFEGSVAAEPPSAADGVAALTAAFSGEPFAVGAVGAGAGATTGKWRSRLDPGGLGVAFGSAGDASLVAVVVVNAWGDVIPASGPASASAVSTPEASAPSGPAPSRPSASGAPPLATPPSASPPSGPGLPPELSVKSPFGNTTIGVLLTDARLSKTDCFLLAQSGHTGYARAIHPAHSRYDGDAVVALATGSVDGDLDLLRAAAAETMAAAIRDAVSHA